VRSIKISKYVIGPMNPVFTIAEAGINHNGSLTTAKKMAKVAKKAGVSCVKFQTHITEKEMIKTNIKPGNISKKTLWSIIKGCELSECEEGNLQKYCKELKILFLSTPFSKEAVDRLEKIRLPAYKIGSGEITNIPFLIRIAQTKKPVILSTGMSTMKEIRDAVKIFKGRKVPLAILQTTSTYPSAYKDIKLGLIEKFEKEFKIPVGISDHSIGTYIAFGAVAKGACIVEKHFTLDKKMAGPDQNLSLEPNELRDLVIGCNAIKVALGNTKKILNDEKPILKFARESVVSIKDINKGEKFSDQNISTKRPGTGKIIAKDFFKIIGRIANRNITKEKQLSWNDIK